MDQINLVNESISTADACEFLECEKPKLLELLREGVLPGLKFGKAWVIPRVAFIETVNRLAVEGAAERRASAWADRLDQLPDDPPRPVVAQHPPPSPTPAPSEPPPRRRGRPPFPRTEEYMHHGIVITISPWGHREGVPTYSATLTDPASPSKTNRVWCVGPMHTVRPSAEAEAERRGQLRNQRRRDDPA